MSDISKRLKPHCDLRLEELEAEFIKIRKIKQLTRELDKLEKELDLADHDVFLDWERVSNEIDALAHEFFYMHGLKDCRELMNEVFFPSR